MSCGQPCSSFVIVFIAQDYAEAARLRDKLKDLEQQSVSASLRASEWDLQVCH